MGGGRPRSVFSRTMARDVSSICPNCKPMDPAEEPGDARAAVDPAMAAGRAERHHHLVAERDPLRELSVRRRIPKGERSTARLPSRRKSLSRTAWHSRRTARRRAMRLLPRSVWFMILEPIVRQCRWKTFRRIFQESARARRNRDSSAPAAAMARVREPVLEAVAFTNHVHRRGDATTTSG